MVVINKKWIKIDTSGNEQNVDSPMEEEESDATE